jgi:DNA-binding LacI/PurR family transcriptional regulator
MKRKPPVDPPMANRHEGMAPGARALSMLRQWIRDGRFPGGARLPAEQALAEDLDVSRGTVRGALDKLEREGLLVSRKGRGRVVVRGVSSAGSLMSRAVALLTIVPSDAARYRLSGFMEAIEVGAVEAVTRAGLHSLTLHPDGLDDSGVRRLLSDKPIGMLVSHAVGESGWGPPVITRLLENGLRIVVNGDRPEFAGYDRVISDHDTGAYKLTHWLLARGKRRILRVWTADPDDYWMKARDAGYERACAEAGVKALPPVHVKGLLNEPERNEETFNVQTRQFTGYLVDHLAPGKSVDAIMATTDAEVYPIAAACVLLGRQPNEDIDLVGYDCNWSACTEREWVTVAPLASVDKLNHRTGERMVELLLDRAAGKLPAEPQRVVIEPELVVLDGSEPVRQPNGAAARAG